MWTTISKGFFSGLAVIVPVAVAIGVLHWAVGGVEAVTRDMLLLVMPEAWYVLGTGLVLALAAILAVGLATRVWLTRVIVRGFEGLLERIPVFSSIYKPAKDLMDMLQGDFADQLGQPVLIRVPNTELETLGFITRQDLHGLPDGFGDPDRVVVYVQWSSQIGGYCFIVPRDHVREVDLSAEAGMRWALTAGLSADVESSSNESRNDQERTEHDHQ